MSISDALMWHYAAHLLVTPQSELNQLQKKVEAGTAHPMDIKKQIAHDIVAKFWSKSEADAAQKQFESLFQKRDYSTADEISLPTGKAINIVELLRQLDVAKSNAEAKRLIEGGGVHLDQETIKDFRANVTLKSGMVIKVGKHRIFKVK